MPLLSDDVEQFLENTIAADGRELDVAILYARSMAAELRASVADWEAAAARLRKMKGRHDVDCN